MATRLRSLVARLTHAADGPVHQAEEELRWAQHEALLLPVFTTDLSDIAQQRRETAHAAAVLTSHLRASWSDAALDLTAAVAEQASTEQLIAALRDKHQRLERLAHDVADRRAPSRAGFILPDVFEPNPHDTPLCVRAAVARTAGDDAPHTHRRRL